MSESYKIRKNMSACAGFKKLISTYIDAETGFEESESVSAHISQCPSCKRELSNMLAIRDMIKYTYAPKEKINISASIMSAIKAKDSYCKNMADGKGKTPFKVTILRYTAVAAVVFAALGATVMYSQNQTKKMLAEERKFDTYVVEHSIQASGDTDTVSQVIAVNFEK